MVTNQPVDPDDYEETDEDRSLLPTIEDTLGDDYPAFAQQLEELLKTAPKYGLHT